LDSLKSTTLQNSDPNLASSADPADHWAPQEVPRQPLKIAYFGMLLFIVIYFGRPEDWIPGAALIPFALIAGVIAFLGVAASVVNGRRLYLPKEMWLMLLLVCQLWLTVPFSSWRGGSFQVVSNFSKVALNTFLIVQIIDSVVRLRRIILLHASGVVITTLASVSGKIPTDQLGRITGALGGPFENPNDLALSMALVLPFCIGLFLSSRNKLGKAFWMFSIGLLVYGVIATYSRGGFLSMLIGAALSLWYFGFRQKRMGLLFMVLMAGMAITAISPGKYAERLQSILNPAMDLTGSYVARQDLLNLSVHVALHHPLLGVGPGQFAEISGVWRVAHNSYTEFAAEAGIPALLLFVVLLLRTFVKVVRTQKSKNPDVQIFSIALRGSLAAFMAGAFFTSCEYQTFPYLIIGYCIALFRISRDLETEQDISSRGVLRQTEVSPCAG